MTPSSNNNNYNNNTSSLNWNLYSSTIFQSNHSSDVNPLEDKENFLNLFGKWCKDCGSSDSLWKNDKIMIYTRSIPPETIYNAFLKHFKSVIPKNPLDSSDPLNLNEFNFKDHSEFEHTLWNILNQLTNIPFIKQSARLKDFHSDIASHLKDAQIGSRYIFQKVNKNQKDLELKQYSLNSTNNSDNSDNLEKSRNTSSKDFLSQFLKNDSFIEIFVVPFEVSKSNLKLIEENKQNGNISFQEKSWVDSLKYYKAGIWLAEKELESDENKKSQTQVSNNIQITQNTQHKITQSLRNSSNLSNLSTFKLQCHSNLSQVYLNLNLPKKSLEQSKLALAQDSQNVKVLFRKAIAEKMIEEYEEALSTLEEALKYDFKNVAVLKEKEKVQSLYDNYQRKSKRMIKSMFS